MTLLGSRNGQEISQLCSDFVRIYWHPNSNRHQSHSSTDWQFFHYSSKQLNSSNRKTPAHNGNANNSECMTAPALGVHAQLKFFLVAGYPLKICESWNQTLQFQTRFIHLSKSSSFKIVTYYHILSPFSWGIQHDSTHFWDIPTWLSTLGTPWGWPPGPPCPGHRAAHASHRAGADGTCRALAGGVLLRDVDVGGDCWVG